MKKISLALCAAALALSAFFVSCANGATEYIDVSTQSYSYAYTVSGTITAKNSYVNTASDTSTITESVYTIADGVCLVNWEEYAVKEYDYVEYTLDLEYTADITKKSTSGSITTSTESKNGSVQTLSFRKIGDKFYRIINGSYVEVSVDGDFEDDDTIKISTNYTYKGTVIASTDKNDTDWTYSLTLQKVTE